jgi:flagellar biosynthesis protein FlhF
VPTPAPLDDEAADLALELERSGITAAGAEALVRELRFHVGPFADGSLRDLARRRIAAKIRVEHGWEPDGSARRIALVGASGVGKTTAVANLAAGLTRGGMTVGIIVIERRPEGEHAVLPRLGATGGSDADRALAYMAGTDVIRVGTPAEMRRAITRLAGRDAVLIDTPGLSRDDVALAELRDVLEAAVAHELHAVVPLGIADREAAAVLARLARLGATRLLVTKTDEARFAGPIYNLATGYELPLGYLGCAPTVPGGLTPADGGSIASRILPI